MDKLIIKPNAGTFFRNYLFIALIFPAMPTIISLFDFIFNRETFNAANYHDGYLYMSALGLGLFFLMTIVTIPVLLKEKIIITAENQLVLQLAFKKPQVVNIYEIQLIERAYTQRGKTKIQVVRVYTSTYLLEFELKKYQSEDITNLLNNLITINHQIKNQFSIPQGFKDELLRYFKA